MNRRLLVAASVFALLLTGCGDKSSPVAPETPLMSGGYVVGGNEVGGTGGGESADTAASRSGGYAVGGN